MTTPHRHDPFPAPDEPADRYGVPGAVVDGGLIGGLISAAFDACMPCQADHIRRMVDDRVSVTRLIELACVTVAKAHGGLPRGLTDLDAPGVAAPAFRRAAAAGLDEQHQAMFEVVSAFDHDELHAAVDSALDLLAGYLFGSPFGVTP